jgi:hypothetical protein
MRGWLVVVGVLGAAVAVQRVAAGVPLSDIVDAREAWSARLAAARQGSSECSALCEALSVNTTALSALHCRHFLPLYPAPRHAMACTSGFNGALLKQGT